MPLLNILPSLRPTAARLDPAVWPATTHYRNGRIVVGGVALHELANRFPAPTYVLDESSVRGRRATTADSFGDAEVLYHPGRFLTSQIGGWVAHQNLSLIVNSVSELATARRSGCAPSRIVLVVDSTGYKSIPAPGHVGRIVVDSSEPLDKVSAAQSPQKTLVRVHSSRCSRGTIARAIDLPALSFVGVRCDTAPTRQDVHKQVSKAVAVMSEAYRDHGVLSTELHVAIAADGSGAAGSADLGVALGIAIDDACIRNRFPRPRVSVDFGETLSRGAATTLTRVCHVDRSQRGRPKVVVAGRARASTDNLAAAAVANRHPLGPTESFTLTGSHREPSDPYFTGVVLPQDITTGDIVALVTSNGDVALAPTTVVSIADGQVRQDL